MSAMEAAVSDPVVLGVFLFVYIGMILGEFRGLALDRTGIVVLGAITLVVAGRVSPQEAWNAVHVPTIALLFGLMVVSAQFRLGGFYSAVARRITESESSPRVFLAQVIVLSALLSALLVNDIICLALSPVLIEGCARRKLNPVPYLLALACAANIGSAATLIGNPQNMLIGQVLKLSFSGYMRQALIPCFLSLGALWLVVACCYRSRWSLERSVPEVAPAQYDSWQTNKGLAVLAALVGFFLLSTTAREVMALFAAGILLMSRRTASSRFLSLVDWHLLVLFMGLFVVNHSLQASGLLGTWLDVLRRNGVDPNNGVWLVSITVLLSNLVSNVPAVMLLLPASSHPDAGVILALASTMAGNLFLVGSIANLIVVEEAAELGVAISWREHARVGIPVTLLSLLITSAWLLRS